jgi:hypothetical protein
LKAYRARAFIACQAAIRYPPTENVLQKARKQDGSNRTLSPSWQAALKARIDASRSATVGRIAGDVQEFAVLLALRACRGRDSRGDQEPALAAFPIREAALRADISLEPSAGRIPAVSTSHLLLIAFHFMISFPISVPGWSACESSPRWVQPGTFPSLFNKRPY